jgi:hypothetical protein
MKRYWDAKKHRVQKPAHVASNPVVLAGPPGGNAMSMATEKIVGQKIGRPCCGGREMEQLVDDNWSVNSFVENNNFQGWSCMINWYFLYIHQEIDKIWHHQTCQVNMSGNLGPICKVSEFDKYCDEIEQQFATGGIPYIRCPKTHCGCGLCVPKSKERPTSRIYLQVPCSRSRARIYGNENKRRQSRKLESYGLQI